MNRISTLLLSSLLTFPLSAAMLRVRSVEDSRTIIVEQQGAPVAVRLGGIEIIDDAGARALLEWSLTASWVVVEEQAPREYFVWRSPDAMFVNRELVQRGYARATLASVLPPTNVVVTYLGTIDPVAAPRQVRTERPRGSGSDTKSRPPARRSRPGRRRR